MPQRNINTRVSVNQSLEQKQKNREKDEIYKLRSEKDKSATIEFDIEFNSFKNEIEDLLKEFDQNVGARLSKIDVKLS